MLETIVLIASIISALSALSTSLRALGKSREYSRNEAEALQSGARLSSMRINHVPLPRNQLLIYRTVTLIWFALSMIFAAPFIFAQWQAQRNIWIPLSVFLLFLLLGTLLWFIWRHIICNCRTGK